MATLTNTKIKDTYDGLLKTTTNDVLGASGVTLIEDGLGNASAISIGRANNGVTITGAVTATSIVKTGGTSSQFLKADGSIDSNTYLTSESDTLDSVTDRGASTTNAITVGGLTSAGYIYPTSGGTSGQAIVTDGAGNLSFATVTSPTPTLQQVTTAGATTTDSITVGGLTASGISYPSADGNAGQVLATNGSGTLGFINVSSGGGDLDDVLAAGNESTREAIVGAITVKGATTNAGMKMWQGNNGLAANLGIGYSTLLFVTTGTNNTVIGGDSGLVISSGGQNVALGNGSLSSLTTSSRNVAIGYNSLFYINGNDNVAVGQTAGTYYYDGVTLGNKTLGTQNIYIGTGVRSAAANTTNEMVFGYGATGNGSNTATYGNNSITDHIFTSGNVGIGTNSPNRLSFLEKQLAIESTQDGGIHLIGNRTTADSGIGYLTFINDSSSVSTFNKRIAGVTVATGGNAQSGVMQFYTSDTSGTLSERMRITSGGDVLIGKDSGSVSPVGHILNSAGSYYSTISNLSDTLHVYDNTNSVYRFYVSGGGTVYATNTTISAISDARLKENIQDLTGGLDAVLSLKPRTYDWKADSGQTGTGVRGFIAQEVEEVFPEYVDEYKTVDVPEDGVPYKSVRQDFIPILVKAIQEQQEIINDLKARIETLENK